MEDFKIAVAQFDLKLGDKERNLQKAEDFVVRASKKGADFVILPEYLSTGSAPERFKDLSEPLSGFTFDALKQMSGEHDIHIVASVVEDDSGRIYNTSVLTSREGTILAKYRKIHLFMDEQKHVEHGKKVVTVDTDVGKVGLMICYDTVFPEVARKLAMEGVVAILVPANWPDPFKQQWRLATSARALDNQVWIAASNRIGADDKFTYFGCSRVVDPYGTAVVECGDGEELAVAEIKGSASQEFRGAVDFLKDRRDL